MTATALDDITALVPEGDPQFPFVSYDADGDCLEFLATGDGYYAVREDALVTVYRSRETNEIIGSLIKGVRKYLEKVVGEYPGFGVEIQDGKFRLSQLFTVRMWKENESPRILTYKKLRDVADDCDAEADLDGAAGGLRPVPC